MRLLGLTPLMVLGAWTWQGDNIRETIQLSRYQPPQEVAKLASEAKMSETGRKIFYLNTPIIESKKVGLNLCKKKGSHAKTVILGCYVSNRGIFIQKVTDQRLAGIMQVTAAHEMLHSAYGRLANSEREAINRELNQVFSQLKNRRIRNLIEIYRQQDPQVVNNELHSILGTEVANLGTVLETHYSRYFSDRSQVVGYAQKYEQAFEKILRQAEEVEQQINVMKPELTSLEAAVKNGSANLTQQRRELDRLQKANNVAEYNRRVASYNQQVDSYNRQVNSLKQKVATYNRLVKTYNALSSEEKSLNQSLTSEGN